MRTTNGQRRPTSGIRVTHEPQNWQPCPGKCGASTIDGRWCLPCCISPARLLSKLREAMEALEAHRAPEDAKLVGELHKLTTDALWHSTRHPGDRKGGE
jgi:hypothetical protein